MTSKNDENNEIYFKHINHMTHKPHGFYIWVMLLPILFLFKTKISDYFKYSFFFGLNDH